MKKTLLIATMLAAPIILAGCDKKADAPSAEASPDAMGNIAMPAEAKMAKGTGTVTAIDAATGKITLDHGPIAALEWPAMEMGFSADAAAIKSVKLGESVRFEIEWNGKTGRITKLEPFGR